MYFCEELIYLSPVTIINISFGFSFVYMKRIHAWVFVKKKKKKKSWKKTHIFYLFLLTLTSITDILHVWQQNLFSNMLIWNQANAKMHTQAHTEHWSCLSGEKRKSQRKPLAELKASLKSNIYFYSRFMADP